MGFPTLVLMLTFSEIVNEVMMEGSKMGGRFVSYRLTVTVVNTSKGGDPVSVQPIVMSNERGLLPIDAPNNKTNKKTFER